MNDPCTIEDRVRAGQYDWRIAQYDAQQRAQLDSTVAVLQGAAQGRGEDQAAVKRTKRKSRSTTTAITLLTLFLLAGCAGHCENANNRAWWCLET